MEKANPWSIKHNLSRLSGATPESKASSYTSRMNASRLSVVDASAFVPNATLFSRIGGASVVSATVRSFYGKALVDPRLSALFDYSDAAEVEGRVKKQIQLVSAMLGGPVRDDLDLRKSRHALSALGLGAAQFDAVQEHLAAILRGQNMPHPLIEELLAFSENLRKEILG